MDRRLYAPTDAGILELICEELCQKLGYQRSQDESRLIYRPLRPGYLGAILFTAAESDASCVRIVLELLIISQEVNRVLDDLFNYRWDKSYLLGHPTLINELWRELPRKVQLTPTFYRRIPWLTAHWNRLALKQVVADVRLGASQFFDRYASIEALAASGDDPRLAEYFVMDWPHTLACLLIAGEREKGLGVLDFVLEQAKTPETRQEWLLWRKRYAEYVYTPRYPV